MAEKDFIDEKMLSIIIPHFNSVDLLMKLLESIPRLNGIETIVVDDNSDQKDAYNRLKALERFKDVIFLQNEEGPKGAGTCRNIGLSAATGNWVLFADSDDYFLKDFYNIAGQYFTSDYDAVFFTPTSEDLLLGGKSNRHEFWERLINDSLNRQDFRTDLAIRYEFVVPWSKMIKRKLIVDHDIKFDEILVSNDVMFSIKTGYAMDKYLVRNEIIYCVTRGKGTLTKIMNETIFFTRLDTFIRRCIFLRERLSEVEYDTLLLSGMGKIADCILYNLGIRNAIKTYVKLRKNKIKIWSGLSFSPIKLYSKIYRKVTLTNQIKKYF